ncbi:Aste57867_9341 [Aphanomyces stellatus]|uniref:Aste57867_9341 protein n=1 Tax=Aphanomyces stellatus TaxID=120398 RepID=A0A485KMS3_9STRA|nr:hypothetical protein As57867_009305 [Aphanomyces stellatus]VFT86222.1 Aste57867_9341 [Aphanomyces stellatus]
MADVWLVNPKSPDDVRPLSSADEENSLRFDRNSPKAVAFTACLLRTRGLTTSVINAILFMAGFWLEFYEETHDEVAESAPLCLEYLRLVVPGYMGHSALELLDCVGISLECISHDQGWASDAPDLNGTYVGCNSWIEFNVLSEDGKELCPRGDVCRNVRGSPDFRHHLMLRTDRELLDLMAQPKNELVIYLRAQYGGWANFAKYARISLAFVVGLRHCTIAQAERTLKALSTDHAKQTWWGPPPPMVP